MTLVETLAMVPLGHHVRIENTECPESGAELLQAIVWQQRPGADDYALGWVVHHRGTPLPKFEAAVIDMIKERFAPAACAPPVDVVDQVIGSVLKALDCSEAWSAARRDPNTLREAVQRVLKGPT